MLVLIVPFNAFKINTTYQRLFEKRRCYDNNVPHELLDTRLLEKTAHHVLHSILILYFNPPFFNEIVSVFLLLIGYCHLYILSYLFTTRVLFSF